MTYSIVARDPATGDFGVAVQTGYFGVGSVVPWAEQGVGAVATQAFTEISYGPLGLDLMRAGRDAEQALHELLANDGQPGIRQVAMVDAEGRVAVHTGQRCVQSAGHAMGSGVSVQANMMRREAVWPAMLRAFEDTAGPLALRLLMALEAGESEGGDMRGPQSAALLVVGGTPESPRWQRQVDLRVEDHPQPVTELGRLLRLHEAYQELGAANELAAAQDFERAAEHGERAVAMAPDDHHVAFWVGLTMAGAGRYGEAKMLLDRAAAANPDWAGYLRRLPAAGMIPDLPQVFDALLPFPAD